MPTNVHSHSHAGQGKVECDEMGRTSTHTYIHPHSMDLREIKLSAERDEKTPTKTLYRVGDSK